MSLHTWNKNDINHSSLKLCLTSLKANDILLLLEEASYALLQPEFLSLINKALPDEQILYVLGKDLAARGISDKIPPAINVLEYTDFVALCLEHDKVINWT